jgi:hypothetical protein
MMRNHQYIWGSRKGIAGIFLAVSIAFACFGISAPVSSQSAGNPRDILVIASKSVSAENVTVESLRDLFLKIRKGLSIGTKTVVVNNSNAELRNDFRASVLKMSESEENRYWQEQQVKSGEGEPTAFGNTLKAVFSLRSAVSYVYREDYKEGVAKVLFVIPAKKK